MRAQQGPLALACALVPSVLLAHVPMCSAARPPARDTESWGVWTRSCTRCWHRPGHVPERPFATVMATLPKPGPLSAAGRGWREQALAWSFLPPDALSPSPALPRAPHRFTSLRGAHAASGGCPPTGLPSVLSSVMIPFLIISPSGIGGKGLVCALGKQHWFPVLLRTLKPVWEAGSPSRPGPPGEVHVPPCFLSDHPSRGE